MGEKSSFVHDPFKLGEICFSHLFENKLHATSSKLLSLTIVAWQYKSIDVKLGSREEALLFEKNSTNLDKGSKANGPIEVEPHFCLT